MWRRALIRVRTIPRGLLIVLALGLAARIAVMLLYSSADFHFFGSDANRYVRLANTPLFSDLQAPAGYPTFLIALRGISTSLPFTIFVQHLLGLGTAVFLYLTVRFGGGPTWAALIAAGVGAFSGDLLFLEHTLLTETLWLFLLSAGVAASVRGLQGPRRSLPWLAGAGVLLALAALVRAPALALPVFVGFWAAITARGVRRALRDAAAVVVPALAVVGLYLGVVTLKHGHSGLTETAGFELYGRVAQFADCSKFTPPPGTRRLCTTTPPAQRPGPSWQLFNPASPLRNGGLPSEAESALLGRFARQAIINQPFDFLGAVATDMVRYVDPDFQGARPFSGDREADMSFGKLFPIQQGQSLQVQAATLATEYTDVGQPPSDDAATAALADYQKVVRLNGVLVGIAFALFVAGIAVTRRRAVHALWVPGVTALWLYLVPAVAPGYDIRYATPPGPLLAAAGAMGAALVAEAIRRRFAAGQRARADQRTTCAVAHSSSGSPLNRFPP